jgi:hypothetical protein
MALAHPRHFSQRAGGMSRKLSWSGTPRRVDFWQNGVSGETEVVLEGSKRDDLRGLAFISDAQRSVWSVLMVIFDLDTCPERASMRR